MKIGDKVKCISEDSQIIVGEIYTVEKVDDHYGVVNKPVVWLVGKSCPFYQKSFEVVEMSLEEQIKLAKSYIGKKIKWGIIGGNCIVEKVDVVLDKATATKLKICSGFVEKELEKNAVVVVLSNIIHSIPLNLATLCDDVTVKLNENHSAIVTKGTIKVGCQTFPISIIDDLVKARDTFK